ncbi:hypothetical protein BCR44DRAFT_1427901 [Catenaria anguillulae PL171]|uniref:Man1/Src1-like C-terminal domain-containing protein n=1 Tax=Catenaria anguillulae PL171 TaxID=765915 RepID=A0A1Y2HW49_9FUNG|nr:hypothetical protein BCR44DRAFT_1427901 [Catenaria anguillulae PL171]
MEYAHLHSAPEWLSDSFDVTKATKWDLRRWMGLYDVPVPAADVRLADLRRLFLDHVYANRRALIKRYHSLPLPSQASASLSPIPSVTPERVSSVQVNVRDNPAAAAAVASGMISSAQDSPSASAAAASRRRKQQHQQEHQQPTAQQAHAVLKPPVFNRSSIFVQEDDDEPSSRRTVKPLPASATSSSTSYRPSADRRHNSNNQDQDFFSRRTVRPSEPKPSADSQPEDLSITPTRPAFSSHIPSTLESPPSLPVWTPQLGAIAAAQALSHRPTSIPAPRPPVAPSTTLSPSIEFRGPLRSSQPRLKSTKKPFRRSRTDTVCSRLGLLLPTLLLTWLAAWVYVRATLPYCPTTASARRLVACKDKESMLQPLGWSLAAGGREFACVPDDQLRANVEKVVHEVVQDLRQSAGRAQCVAESGGNKGDASSAWVTRKDVREQYIARALSHVARGVPPANWPCTPTAHSPSCSRTQTLPPTWTALWVHDDMYALEDDLDRVRALRPVYPLTCRMRRALRAMVHEYWRQALGALTAALIATAWRKRYLRNLYLRELAASLAVQVTELLARQPVGDVLGFHAVHSKFKREYVDKLAKVTVAEWGRVWYAVEVELERDHNVRRVCVQHRGQAVEAWEWVGFEALADKDGSSGKTKAE